MCDAALPAPANPVSKSTLRQSSGRESCLWISFGSHCPRSFLGPLSRQIGQEEAGDAVLVTAFLLVQHTGVVPVHQRSLIFRLRCLDEKAAGDLSQFGAIGSLYE